VVRQDAEPLVVDNETQATRLGLLAPSDEVLPSSQAERRRPEADKRDPFIVLAGDVAKNAPDEVMAEIVVLIEQLVEPRDLTWRDQPDDERVEAVLRAAVRPPACSTKKESRDSTHASAHVRSHPQLL